MSYTYLFKYIIIGDTGKFISEKNKTLIFIYSIVKALANRVYYFNLLINDFSLFMI